MAENVPMIDIGRARLGMMVARTLRRNTKITPTTSTSAISSVSCTSRTEARIDCERSYRRFSDTEGGTCARKVGSSASMASTTSMVLVPGWRWMARITPRVPLYQAATLSF